MTGFATAEIDAGKYRLVWEIRSVNHRYLDLGFRVPDDFRSLESRLRRIAAGAITRGKVDCTLRVTESDAAAGEDTIDVDRLAALRKLEAKVIASWPEADRLAVVDILRWPGVLRGDDSPAETLAEPVTTAFGAAVDALRTARDREGRRLADVLLERLDAIDTLLIGVEAELATAAPKLLERLRERVARLEVETEPERLEQELALIAQRSDVREEADRLKAHIAETRSVLMEQKPIGRRLDFLIQELNREANTLASKVQDESLTRAAVDLKVLIEQMREQVQNLE